MILALVKAKSFDDPDQRKTLINVVQFSLIGSIFSNSLLVLGCAFLAPGFKKDSHFNVQATSANVSLLMLASFVMILPAPYEGKSLICLSTLFGTFFFPPTPMLCFCLNKKKGSSELAVSRAAAILLLIMYSCLLVFVLFTHKDIGENKELVGAMILHEIHSDGQQGDEHEHDHEHDHDHDHNHDHEHENEHQHSKEKDEEVGHAEEDDDELKMSMFGSMALLLSTTILVAVLSEFLVAAIEPMSSNAGIKEAFVGMILLPIIGNCFFRVFVLYVNIVVSFGGNAVEHITAIRMARKGKMDIALSIAIGSATQVAMFVVALAVIVGWILDIPMTLDFPQFEVQMFIYTSIIIFALISDGSSNWLEGAMLLCLYVMIAIAVWHQEI
ncbi:hypothetical protein RFI_04750 [Reticulomyxa filosa]|uniref:Sodium/calcium exchanger membrane region domain-containing protein n=1 Tax=Reticulomyxa filosa TaxID=46433 RepID=X6P2N9_RETFI|nr:hypothetical protein RFI_04750 [Reticulomyxa filosa]|eukprot:ETO32368.1 hypothetical protein RFI_04750 [Reticulomyxa filosa]